MEFQTGATVHIVTKGTYHLLYGRSEKKLACAIPNMKLPIHDNYISEVQRLHNLSAVLDNR